MTRQSSTSKPWRLPLLLTFAMVVGCSSADPPGVRAGHDLDHDMFTTGYEALDQLYVQKPDLQAVATSGLSALSKIDNRLSVTPENGKLDLDYDGKTAATFIAGGNLSADDWADLTTNALAAARKVSPKVEKADGEKVYKAMFDGMTSRLDRFSRYEGREEATDEHAMLEGFGGLGVDITFDAGVVRIVGIQRFTPAERAGLLANDIIGSIDGVPTKSLDEQTVVDRLRGPVGSKVALTIERAGAVAPLEITVRRAHIVPETVAYKREGDVAYIQISEFNESTAASVRSDLETARSDIGSRMRGIVLDLRDDPGGLLNQGVAVADLFIDSGLIVSTRGRDPDSVQHFNASDGDVTKGLPMAVLINGDSASAAEIVASALQDSGRAVVIGSNSYGKGTVQTVLDMPNGGEFVLTWARFFAPSGYTLNHLGVLPTICTDGGQAATIMADLAGGRLKAVPVSERNSTSPDDTAALDRLRALCPAYHGAHAVDLDVALRLLAEPRLYSTALALAGPTAKAAQAQ